MKNRAKWLVKNRIYWIKECLKKRNCPIACKSDDQKAKHANLDLI